MLHTRAANIRCDRYCSNFLEIGMKLNKGLLHFTKASAARPLPLLYCISSSNTVTA